MIERYELTLRPPAGVRPQWEWGYRLYGALLEQLPADFGRDLHADAITPVSQYALPREDGTLLWTVTLFGENAIAQAGPLLAAVEQFSLRAPKAVLRVVSRRRETIGSVEVLLARAEAAGNELSLTFVTPTAFKRKGRYVCLPEIALMLPNLVKQWNGCFPDCPIEDTDGEGVLALAEGLECTGLNLRSAPYYLKGSGITGCTGRLWLRNRSQGFHRTLTNALLLFGGYCGVGIKTTLGMGGCQVRWSADA